MANRSMTLPSTRDHIATGLMFLSALAALYAVVSAAGSVVAAGPETQQVEVWRMMGFAFFGALFLLLAFWPRRYPYLWELLIVSKGGLTVIEALLARTDATNALSSAIADGALTIVLIGAYLLSRGYTSRHQQRW